MVKPSGRCYQMYHNGVLMRGRNGGGMIDGKVVDHMCAQFGLYKLLTVPVSRPG